MTEQGHGRQTARDALALPIAASPGRQPYDSISPGPPTPLAEPDNMRILIEAGYWLHLVRAVEEAGRRLYLQGRLPGSFYDGRGQEATAVGAALAMRRR